MTAFLQGDAAMATRPVPSVLIVLGAASVVPAFFSVVFILQNNLWNWGTAVLWSSFLGLGAIAAIWMLHDFRQEGRDLVDGVFVRSTGVFSTKVSQTKYGLNVQVVVGGRALFAGHAPQLESIESAPGTVDYLPVSGDLLEVRDESGQVLWSRFAGAQTAPA